MNKKQTITPRQLVFVLVGSQIAASFLSLPRNVAQQLGQNAWMAVLLGALLPLLAVFLIERLGRKVPELNFVKMVQAFLGKIPGTISIMLVIAYVIYSEAVKVRIFSEITNEYLLPRTPLAVVELLTMLGVVYVISKGARVIGRMNELLFYILLFPLLTLLIPLPAGDITNLLPVGGFGLKEMGQGILATTYAYSGNGILLIFYFLTDRKNEVMKAGLIATAITAGIYVLVTITSILVFGADIVQKITWPGINLLKVISFPTVQRLELFFLAVWMGLGIRPAINLGFAVSYSFCELFNIDMNKYFIYVVAGIAAAIYIISLYPENIAVAFKWAEYAGIGYLGASIIYPLILHLGALLRGKKVKIYV